MEVYVWFQENMTPGALLSSEAHFRLKNNSNDK